MTVSDWSSTAGLNTLSSGTAGTGGVNIDEGMAPSGVNNAIRDIMAQWATFITDANFTLTSTDAGATANPTLTLYRNSASPAASDIIGKVIFRGEDSASAATDYGAIQAVITDATDASEDATLQFLNFVAGTQRATLQLGAGLGTLTSFDATSAAGPTWQLHRNSATPAAADVLGILQFVGQDDAGNSHTYAQLYGVLDDPANGSEDGSLGVQLSIAGTIATRLQLTSTGATVTGAVGADTIAGSMIASQAEQETGTATDKIVTPGRQHFHASAAKAWVKFDASSGTPTISSSYNMTSLTDGGVGITTVNIATVMSSAANNIPIVSAGNSGTRQNADLAASGSITAGAFQVVTATDAAVLTDCSVVTGVVFGDI